MSRRRELIRQARAIASSEKGRGSHSSLEVTERNRADAGLKSAFNEISQLKDRLAQEKLYLEEEISTAQGFEDVIGDSSALRAILRRVAKVAPTDSTVMIQGETGTGRSLLHELFTV